MRKVICYAFLLLFLISCISTEKGILISELPEYINKEGYKNLYVVDTIKIENPVRFFTKRGHQFVMSQKAYQSYDGKEKSLFKRADTFLLEHELPMGLGLYDKYNFKGSDCAEYSILFPDNKKGISTIYSYSRNPDFFLLILIRGDYYNYVYTGIDGPPPIKSKNEKFVFYRVAIPYCMKE